ncbi:sigma-70 family RNA polymerase sigma factor [Clostridium sp. 'White wine YQ']|uniref:sigma-70 family RNA polymerase sigma factor n=1 Tax=Clostridium sp. 'White wine YQ' TaxID=3027474 RepID=UPI002366C66D|nr:sigma-70 family RNA polymerase sigma factor [Clostridium sp. 'White wine YQ']MDD7792762.1 sigma-70 family RNA polymerase sigma factor [Clostridium sp. 'White wine YQ']
MEDYLLTLVKKSKLNDMHSMEEIISLFTPLIKNRTKSLYIKNHDEDDLMQIGRISIIKAINKYDISRGSAFISYVKNTIDKNYFYEIRKNTKCVYETSIPLAIKHSKFCNSLFMSEENIEANFLDKELHYKLSKTLASLSTTEKELIEYVYFKNTWGGLTLYSKEKALPYSEVLTLRNKILSKLKNALTL